MDCSSYSLKYVSEVEKKTRQREKLRKERKERKEKIAEIFKLNTKKVMFDFRQMNNYTVNRSILFDAYGVDEKETQEQKNERLRIERMAKIKSIYKDIDKKKVN